MKLRNFLLLLLVLVFSVVACADETTTPPVIPAENTPIKPGDFNTLTGKYKIDNFIINNTSATPLTMASDNYTLIQDFIGADLIITVKDNKFTSVSTLELESIFAEAAGIPTLYYDNLNNKTIVETSGDEITDANNNFTLTIKDGYTIQLISKNIANNTITYNLTKLDDAVTPLPTNNSLWGKTPIDLDANPLSLIGRYYIGNFTYNKTTKIEKLVGTTIADIENILGLLAVTVDMTTLKIKFSFAMQSDESFGLGTTPDTYVYQDITKDISIDLGNPNFIADIFTSLGAVVKDTETLTLTFTDNTTALDHTLPITGTDNVTLTLKKINNGKLPGITPEIPAAEMVVDKPFWK